MTNQSERLHPWDGYGKTHFDEMEPAPPSVRGSLVARVRDTFIAPMTPSVMLSEEDAAYRTDYTATKGAPIVKNRMKAIVEAREYAEQQLRRHPELAQTFALLESTFAYGLVED